MKLTSIRDVKELLSKNGLRYHHITQNILLNDIFEFKVVFEHLSEDAFIKVQNILDLGIRNVKFELIDYY